MIFAILSRNLQKKIKFIVIYRKEDREGRTKLR